MADRTDYRNRAKTAKILGPDGPRREELEALAQSFGLDLLPFDHAFMPLDQDNGAPIQAPDFLLSDLRSEPEQIGTALDAISQYLNGYGTELLVWVSADQLDFVYARLPEQDRHILCDAPDHESIPILTGALKRMKMQGLRQEDTPTDYRSLHRISDELADFARTLARIAEHDDPQPHGLRDKPVSFRPAPSAIFESLAPFRDVPAAPREPSPATVRAILKLRRKREGYFDKNLFADPAWDILLDLYAARLEGKKVSVSSLCIAAAVPPTTALRWISAMTEDGLLMREHDPDDARRVFIRLSTATEEGLRSYFIEMGLDDRVPI
jgi:DNA-binding MarR family transcriptional regulator